MTTLKRLCVSLGLCVFLSGNAFALPDTYRTEKFKLVDIYPSANNADPHGFLFRGSVPIDSSYSKFTLNQLLQNMNALIAH